MEEILSDVLTIEELAAYLNKELRWPGFHLASTLQVNLFPVLRAQIQIPPSSAK